MKTCLVCMVGTGCQLSVTLQTVVQLLGQYRRFYVNGLWIEYDDAEGRYIVRGQL